MFVASTAQTVILNQYFQLAFVTGMRVRAGLVSVIFKKALILSNDERGRASGDIVNLMSVDATRLQDFCQFGLISISGPFQVDCLPRRRKSLNHATDHLGFHLPLSAVRMASFRWCRNHDIVAPIEHKYVFNQFLLRPDQAFIVTARILKRMQEQQMKNRDKRTRLMSEVLANIKRRV